MLRAITPQRKPVLRQKSPLSNEPYFASPASSMPGTFPTTPPAASPSAGVQPAQFTTTVSATPSSSSSTTKSPKRPSSVRTLLSFKALRRSSDHTSPIPQGNRPQSPSTESTISNFQPSLNKKRSGSFWRRKSSLGMTFGKEGEDDTASASPGLSGETVMEEENSDRAPTPAPSGDFPSMKKRKSGTFWRRKSSLNMATAFDGNEEGGLNRNGSTNGATAGKRSIASDRRIEEYGVTGHHENRAPLATNGNGTSPMTGITPTRTWSPPPQLPEFVGGGGGLGGEDLFKDIF